MSRSIVLSALVAFAAFASNPAPAAQDADMTAVADASSCMSEAQVLPDEEHKGKTVAYVTNRCAVPVDMRICLMTESKGWKCGTTSNISPQTSWSLSVSHATGKVFVAARPNGSNQPLNSPADES